MTLCEVKNKGGITMVVMPPQIDHVVATTLDQELQELATREQKAMFCDFSQTKYISSSGLRVILKAAKTLKSKGNRFGIFSLTHFVDHIFATSGFSDIIPMYDTEEAAVRAVTR